jgi:hypothetical protein
MCIDVHRCFFCVYCLFIGVHWIQLMPIVCQLLFIDAHWCSDGQARGGTRIPRSNRESAQPVRWQWKGSGLTPRAQMFERLATEKSPPRLRQMGRGV